MTVSKIEKDKNKDNNSRAFYSNNNISSPVKRKKRSQVFFSTHTSVEVMNVMS